MASWLKENGAIMVEISPTPLGYTVTEAPVGAPLLDIERRPGRFRSTIGIFKFHIIMLAVGPSPGSLCKSGDSDDSGPLTSGNTEIWPGCCRFRAKSPIRSFLASKPS